MFFRQHHNLRSSSLSRLSLLLALVGLFVPATSAFAWNDNGQDWTEKYSFRCYLGGFSISVLEESSSGHMFIRVESEPIVENMLWSQYLGVPQGTWPLGTTTVDLGHVDATDYVCSSREGTWVVGDAVTVAMPSPLGPGLIQDTNSHDPAVGCGMTTGPDAWMDDITIFNYLVNAFNAYKPDPSLPDLVCEDFFCWTPNGVDDGDLNNWYNQLHAEAADIVHVHFGIHPVHGAAVHGEDTSDRADGDGGGSGGGEAGDEEVAPDEGR
ncbi:MAG: hypothetical protein AAGM22_09015 [Acidobacteriota bacterium]